jgi:transcriptional regulator with XRE-family HTH domain
METSEESARLGEVVARSRRARGLRQEDLARAVGVGTSSIRLIERGHALGPSVFTVLRIFRTLEVDLSELDLRVKPAGPPLARTSRRSAPRNDG